MSRYEIASSKYVFNNIDETLIIIKIQQWYYKSFYLNLQVV